MSGEARAPASVPPDLLLRHPRALPDEQGCCEGIGVAGRRPRARVPTAVPGRAGAPDPAAAPARCAGDDVISCPSIGAPSSSGRCAIAAGSGDDEAPARPGATRRGATPARAPTVPSSRTRAASGRAAWKSRRGRAPAYLVHRDRASLCETPRGRTVSLAPCAGVVARTHPNAGRAEIARVLALPQPPNRHPRLKFEYYTHAKQCGKNTVKKTSHKTHTVFVWSSIDRGRPDQISPPRRRRVGVCAHRSTTRLYFCLFHPPHLAAFFQHLSPFRWPPVPPARPRACRPPPPRRSRRPSAPSAPPGSAWGTRGARARARKTPAPSRAPPRRAPR